jgi:HSP20 family molecular chaperone IbpA
VPAISVRKLRELDDVTERLLQEVEDLKVSISVRAYDLYHFRGALDGSDVDDWLQAEREMSWVPQEQIEETDRAFHVVISVSYLPEEIIEVTLLPEMIILRGASEPDNGQRAAEPCESTRRILLRRIAFPSQVHTESAVVHLEADLLRVSAAKLGPE